jgi:serine beta-lactamase-like protein LACTB
MLSTMMLLVPLATPTTLTTPTPLVTRAAPSETTIELAGTWKGIVDGPAPTDLRFALWKNGDAYEGSLRLGDLTALLRGRVEPGAASITIEVTGVDGNGTLELTPSDDGMTGRLVADPGITEFRAKRISDGIDPDLMFEVDFDVERPLTIDRDGLPEFLAEELQSIIDEWVIEDHVVGVSFAFILDFEVIDIRSVGWQDFASRTPASIKTRYRWASISKSVCGVAAMQLVEDGQLDLDRDVREYVPEYPEKEWKLTARNLLRHQGGVVHYQHGPIQTERTYDDPNPFRDRVLALDMFKESPLLFEPGSSYSYTTHGFSLLGAVIERAGKQRFADQVDERIVKALGMPTMGPDFHQSVDIPDQATGYGTAAGNHTIDSGDTNVAWKLPGGGFISSVEDLALFGRGLMEGPLLSNATREEMFTRQVTSTGNVTGYGLGVAIDANSGMTTVGHGGAQRKTRTYLQTVPEIGIGVAVMCNTEGADIGRVANRLIAEMLR